MNIKSNNRSILAAACQANMASDQPVNSVLALSNRGDEAELWIYGLIGDIFWDGITAAAMSAALEQLDVETIRVRINSRGGVATEGIAIYNALKRHPAKVIVVVDGSAESIASLVAMAGDEVVMPANTLMMIHAPFTPEGGNVVRKLEQIEALKSVAAAMAESYVAKTGKREEIEAILADGKDHYFTSAQAIELGLADTDEEMSEVAVSAQAAAAALCSYVSAIADVPEVFASGLRHRIQATATPLIFASLPEVTQRAVVAHIEDPQMKQKFETILAQAGGNNPSPASAPFAGGRRTSALQPPLPAPAKPRRRQTMALLLQSILRWSPCSPQHRDQGTGRATHGQCHDQGLHRRCHRRRRSRDRRR